MIDDRERADWVIGGERRFTIQAKAENLKATEAELLGMLHVAGRTVPAQVSP